MVLKRTYADMPTELAAQHNTWYVYDDLGNLSFVIPPKVDTSDGVSTEELDELCYQYRYDYRKRLVEKKIPGKGWEYIVYNKLDQPVLTRDQNLAANNQWLFTKYDKFGRIVYTGIFSSADSREVLQNTMNGIADLFDSKTNTPIDINGIQIYYDNTAFPTTNMEVLTINYYDNYAFDLDGAVEEDAYGVTPTPETRGLSTGSKVRVLGTDQWITSVIWYDEKARPVYSYTKNPYLNTTDKLKSKLDFVGKVLETTSVHTKDGQADITAIEKFSYDRMGRLLKQTHQMAGQPEETLAENVYDALGQLIQKNVGNTPSAPLQTVDYSYNIRGWLTGINDTENIGKDLFSFNIRYNDPVTGAALYNGNISQTLWRTANVDSSLKNYVYSYDALNRITGAVHNTGNYDLTAINYDKNGNILNLNRQGHINEAADLFGPMDDLIYTYDSGNKLLRVEDIGNDTYGFKDDAVAIPDDADDYSYDDNGNMLSDTNKGITGINYNHLNLPTQVSINGENILYIYDASGIKLQKVADGTTTQYAGAYIYENSSLKFASHAEGYIEPDGGGGYNYVYQYKDHLGNVRLSYSDSNSDGIVETSEIRSEKNYYPFGLQQKGYNNVVNGTHYPFDYNGKENNEELGLNWHDFGARNYDAALGRWMNVDPLADKYYSYSPYNSVLNNPIRIIDPDGMDIYILFYTEGNKDGDEAFRAAAKTRKRNLEKSKEFNSNEDIVLLVGISDISDIKDKAESLIKKHSEKYGQTAEVGVWSHAGLDGPIGSEETSENATGSRQMSLEGWGDIDFNWKSDGTANCNFYGCNTGNESGGLGPNGGKSFADKISRLKNFRKDKVSVSGQTTSSYPSFNPYERRTSILRSAENPGLGFSFGDTYMVGGNQGEGKKALGLTRGPFPTANPMVTYKRGGYEGKSYKPNLVNN